MTSGIHHTVPISSIIIDRASRQRRDLTGIEELAESISRVGLIHAPVITRDSVLIAGERRIEAMKSLGWTETVIQFSDEIDPETLHSIELEENIKRVDMTWQDRALAVAKFHEIRQGQDPEWGQRETGPALGISQAAVAKEIALARAIQSKDPKILSAPKKSVALGILERRESRAKDNESEALSLALPAKSSAPAAPVESVINASFLEWAPAYSGPKFNFIHCDFPYGINADTFNQGAAGSLGGYSDTPDDYWRLVESLCTNLDRIALPSCHLIFWFSMKGDFYHDTKSFLRRHTDFDVDDFPLIWHKSDNVGTLPDPSRGPRRTYETALFASRGDRKVVNAVANSYSAPTERAERIHMSVKPEPMLRHFFRMLVDEHSRVLDPTCGSGSALRAAESLGANQVLGLEMNPEFADYARTELNRARVKRAA